MSQWRISRGDQQLVAKDVAELKLWAAGGKIVAEDLVQAPGSTTWNYALELDELDGLVKWEPGDDDLMGSSSGIGKLGARFAILLAGFVLFGGIGLMVYVNTNMPDTSVLRVEIDAFRGILTRDAQLQAEPGEGAVLASLPKDAQVRLIRKLADHYEVEMDDGVVGWLAVNDLVPGYYFDARKRRVWDPIFNPDAHLQISNYGWQAANDPTLPADLTWFTFAVFNESDYHIGDVVLRIDLKDTNDVVVSTFDYEVPEVVPPRRTLFMDQIEMNIDYQNTPNAKVDVVGGRVLQGDELERALLPTVGGEGSEEGAEVEAG